jgi:phosphinothricin acetyltransferase
VDITPMTEEHAASVLRIYQLGIDSGEATFETHAPDWSGFNAYRRAEHRYVATDGDTVLGWVAVSSVSSRAAYNGVVEHSVYVDPAAQGRGVGRALLRHLIRSTESAGIWTIQAAVFPSNTASIALHQSEGFRIVGTRERIARHRGEWRDVVLIERRSPVVG